MLAELSFTLSEDICAGNREPSGKWLKLWSHV